MFKAFGGFVGSPSWTSHIGDRQQSSDEANHPVIGIGNVMEEVKPELLMQASSCKIGFYLPTIVVELMPTLEIQQWTQPPGESNVVEMQSLDGALGQTLLNIRTVLRLGKRPHFVGPSDLLKQIPP